MPLTALVGLPGSGKSTIGRQLARQLDLRFIDVDTEIERRIGCPIRLFFEREGEERFRDIEGEVLGELVALDGAVVATGGGAILRAENRRLLHDACTVVYLRSTPEAIFRRLRRDRKRPLLQVADPLATLRDLHRVRDPLYRETAHFVIETGRPAVATVTGLITMQLEMAGLVGPRPIP